MPHTPSRTVLGVTVTEPRALPEHGVTVAFVELPNVKLELLEPLEMRGGTASPIASFLSNHKEGGIHHLCLEVDDIAASMQHVARHARLLDKRPKIGAHGLPGDSLTAAACNHGGPSSHLTAHGALLPLLRCCAVVFVHPKDMCGCLTELEEVVKC